MSTPTVQHLAAYWMEERVCGHPGILKFALGCEDHTMDRYLIHLFLRGRKEGPGGNATLVTKGCAAKFFSDSVHELTISMCRSAWKVYSPRPFQIQA